jgi:hypothetical protein
MGKERKVYNIFVGKSEKKGPLGRLRHRGEDGMRRDLSKIGLGGRGGVNSGSCECSNKPSGSGATELVS